MHFENLTEEDLFGRFFIRAPDGGKFTGYYKSLDAIHPLIRREDWLDSVTGFYINVAGNYDAVRLSFFTAHSKRVNEVVDSFIKQHSLENAADSEPPNEIRISKPYGNEELRFRRYLATYTQIGLDIMKDDLLNARCLFATFRWQIMRARKPYSPHFLKVFEEHSHFFNSLSKAEEEQFWSDFGHWPNHSQVDWAHLFVNMVLGCDWPMRMFLQKQAPLPPHKINEIVGEIGFQIPENWPPK